MSTVQTIPANVRPFLWSYDCDHIDIKKDQKLIIFQILNYGSKSSTDWLRKIYSKEQIVKTIETIPASQWNPKSLALWSLVFNTTPKQKTRFIN